MEGLELLLDLHKEGERQGPGSDCESEKALKLTGISGTEPLRVADIGCGTGASTLLLARLLHAKITAVDFLEEFLEVLKKNAAGQGYADRISTLCCSMDSLPFENEEFDLIWSEGAIYNMGFEKGVADWHRFIKPNGMLVVSEITWTTSSRPDEIQKHWDREYPEINVASEKISVLEKHGYSPTGYLVLPESCWLNNYYRPMQTRFEAFLKRHGNSAEAQAIVTAEQREIDLYERFKDFISYGFYVARKIR